MLFRTYRFARAVDEAYPLGVFWVYVGLFLLTFCLIFVFPPVALMLVFAGLLGLLVAVPVGKVLHLMANALARALVSRGVCPSCALRQLPDPEAGAWSCGQCGRSYLRSGLEAEAT